MPELRTGAYVDPASTSAGRNSLGVVIEGKFDTVFITANQGGLKHVDGGLGFQNDAVFQGAKRSFADRLYQLSLELDKRVAEGQNKLKSLSGEAYDQEVLSLLTLTKARSETSLTKLQELGYGLRQKLNQKFVDVLTALGGMKESYLDEPAINFYNHQQLPVLWDMMYEAKAPFEDVEWQRFWGFRFPLTHWDATGRSEHKIRLKQGLFSAIDESLVFASSEVNLLAQQMTGGLCHSSLCDEFKKRALQSLREKNLNEADEWLAAQDRDSWLRRSIQKLHEGIEDEELLLLQTQKWKAKTVQQIFSDPNFSYELIHFACHCEPAKVSELLSHLRIKIAGEEISLSVASMPSDQRPNEPGPLVFLNACGTGQQGNTDEPPGFPESWISNRGAVAVVATLCPVPDLFAHAFARKFYTILFRSVADPQALVRDRYLAEALLETRRYFMQECGNPLGLAYVLYAVKDACIEPRA